MSLLLYAVVPAEATRLQDVGQLAWHPEVISTGTVGVAYQLVGSLPEPTRDVVLEYGRRQGELTHLVGSTLPVRFGSVLADETALRRVLAERSAEWARRLRAVRGCVELVVHVRGGAECPRAEDRSDEHVSGRAYLQRRASERRGSDALVDELRGLLRQVVREDRVLPGEPGTCRLACLVPREAVRTVHRLLAAWATTGGCETQVTGPFPVLDFVQGPPS